MPPFLQQPPQAPRRDSQVFERFFDAIPELLNSDNPYVCPLNQSWEDITREGLRSSALLVSQSLIEGARRMNKLPMDLDLSRLVPQVVTVEINATLQHFLFLFGSQVRKFLLPFVKTPPQQKVEEVRHTKTVSFFHKKKDRGDNHYLKNKNSLKSTFTRMDLLTVIREQVHENGDITDQDQMAIFEMKVPLMAFSSYGNTATTEEQIFSASRFTLSTSVNMTPDFPMADVSPTLLSQVGDVLDAPVIVGHAPMFNRFSWRRFISDTSSCYRRALNPDHLESETGEPLAQFWFFQLKKAKTDGTSIWTLRNPNRFPRLARDSVGWNTFHLLRKYVPMTISLASTSFKPGTAPVLLPMIDSFNELLNRWVLFQKKKSTQKFMAAYRRSGQIEGTFNQEFFDNWFAAELDQMDTFYLLDFFKRMVRETVSPDGFLCTRIFPRLNQVSLVYLSIDKMSRKDGLS